MAHRWLLAASLAAAATSEVVSGFADTVEYQFGRSSDASHFLGMMESFASYVRDHEQEFTYTFRTFRKDDALSVLILERFVNKSAHDGPHLGSAAHTAFAKEVSDWNATTGAIVGKLRSYWQETGYGTFFHGSQGRVSGFADSVVYSFRTKGDAQKYLDLLKPLAAYVQAEEKATTYTFRPFVSADGLDVMLFERFVNKEAHGIPHSSSAAHAAYVEAVTAWNASTGAVVGKVHMDWYETHQGVISRAAGASAVV